MTRIELGVDLGMAEAVYGHRNSITVHIDEKNYNVSIHDTQIHPDSDVKKVGDVGHLVVTRRFAEIKRLL